MIRYSLECACGERFEAWFSNAEGCEKQLASGAVGCPVCAGAKVSKALMAPAVSKPERSAANISDAAPAASKETAPPGAPAASEPDARLAAFHSRAIEQKLRALRAHVEATAEAVGKNFAREARAIHEGEADERPIYGQATPDEVEALLEDGVPVAPIPWIDRRDD